MIFSIDDIVISFNMKIVLISTGGTIEKTYCELEGILHHKFSVLDVILERIRLEGVEIVRDQLMNKDSLDLTPNDVQLLIETVAKYAQMGKYDGIIVVHGTDRLSFTGDKLHFSQKYEIPIVLTGAMRPFMMRNTDAIQNITEALLAVQLLSPGVHVVMHNKVLTFPGIRKNRETMTFEKLIYDRLE